MDVFNQLPVHVTACSLSDIHTHTPVTSSLGCDSIANRVVSLPGKGLNHLSL